jgi:hypothetical protein
MGFRRSDPKEHPAHKYKIESYLERFDTFLK